MARGVSAADAPAQPTEHLPPDGEFLLWPPGIQSYGYRVVDRLFASRPVRASGRPRALPRGPELDLRYAVGGRDLTLADYMQRNHTAGLLILRGGRVVCERYGLGLRDGDRWSTMSMVKSITAMLLGAAVHEGAIASLEDPVTRSLPALAGSAYDHVSVRHLLTMSTGVRWTEVYDDPESDVNRYSRSLAQRVPNGVLNLMRALPGVDAPGSTFRYNSGDSFLLGALVSAATGRGLADYLSERVWTPFGMEFDAFFTLESEGGQEVGGSRAGMTLRDLARFAWFVTQDGVIDGRRVLPEGWVRDAGTPAYAVTDPLQVAAGITGYGYCWWIGADGAMNALGFAGQRIWIDRASDSVVVMLSAWPQPPYLTPAYPDFAAETRSLLAAVRAA